MKSATSLLLLWSSILSSEMAAGEKALIIQNKGGGHGELGYHLALDLTGKGLKVKILNDQYNEQKEPFKVGTTTYVSGSKARAAALVLSYGNLKDQGVEIVSAKLDGADVKTLLGGEKYEYIFDNYAKTSDSVRSVVELSQAESWPLKTYVFVSSGGMYKTGDQFPLLEDDPVSESNGARQVEQFIESSGVPYTFFRPQYIYGPLSNKRDYLDWFFDRLTRGRSIPLPLHGDQFTTLSNAQDVASLIGSVVDNPKAVKQVFNCATDRYVTFRQIVTLVGNAIGQTDSTKKIVTYDPAKHKDLLPKGWWPFRNTHFNVCPSKAKLLLGWQPQHDLVSDLKEYYRGYQAAGLDKKDLQFEIDDKLLA